MKFIGITGGVGAGKSEIIDYLRSKPRILVKKADEVSKELMDADPRIQKELSTILGEDIFTETGIIDRRKMADKIFSSGDMKERVNNLLHPAVKDKILKYRDEAEASGLYDIFFIEAALLIEDGYDKICDELWYVYADPEIRKRRLSDSRGYSRERSESIMGSQLSHEVFKEYCSRIIDNSGSLTQSFRDLDRIISGYTG